MEGAGETKHLDTNSAPLLCGGGGGIQRQALSSSLHDPGGGMLSRDREQSGLRWTLCLVF